jgi:hypothetical protein
LKQTGHHCTLSDEREDLLSSVGFIWDSHNAAWLEHFQSLQEFYIEHGHCMVPPETSSSLNVWCKHQRRQFRHMKKCVPSSMTEERYALLNTIGFDWNPRNLKSF